MLNDTLLTQFMLRFFGYGKWAAPVWFVGMEEGGGTSESELSRRLTCWTERGASDLEDLVGYSQAVGITEWFGPSAKLQTTWRSLARVLLAYEAVAPTRDQLVKTQCSRLGNRNGDAALLELLPLPSPGINQWSYDTMSGLRELRSRAAYTEQFIPLRADHLNAKMKEHGPKLVVCYGMAYLRAWERVAGMSFSSTDGGVPTGRNGSTAVIVMKHPAARGASSAYLQSVGEIGACLNGAA